MRCRHNSKPVYTKNQISCPEVMLSVEKESRAHVLHGDRKRGKDREVPRICETPNADEVLSIFGVLNCPPMGDFHFSHLCPLQTTSI